MNYRKILTLAGVPATLHESAIESIESAKRSIGWHNWHKTYVRIFKYKTLARYLKWGSERLIDVRPDLAKYDIAPNVNITGHGDNAPWVQTTDGMRPKPGRWMNTDPSSDEYKAAVASNYWCPGEHPRSEKSREAWYKRNACEYNAWNLGRAVALSNGVNIWRTENTTVYQCGDVWVISHDVHLFWRLWWNTRVGYEIDNVWDARINSQGHFPIDGYPLKAAVTYSSLPFLSDN